MALLLDSQCQGLRMQSLNWSDMQEGCRVYAPAPEEETACGSEAEGLDLVLAASVADGAELAGGGMIQHTCAMILSFRGPYLE